MDSLMFVVLIGIFIFVCFKNVSLFKRYGKNKKYIDLYKKVLYSEDNCHDLVVKYLENEKSEEFKNKVRIIQIYNELENDVDATNSLNELNFKPIFFKKDKYDNELVKLNSDAFIFIILDIAKAYEKSKLDIADTIINKLKEYPDLESRVEYQTVLAIYKAIKSEDDSGIAFMKCLHDGSYTEYIYDKNMIGLYKRCASAGLAFTNIEFDEFFKNDLYAFAKTFIGERLLKSLGLYETYKPIEEVPQTEEIQTEENK